MEWRSLMKMIAKISSMTKMIAMRNLVKLLGTILEEYSTMRIPCSQLRRPQLTPTTEWFQILKPLSILLGQEAIDPQ